MKSESEIKEFLKVHLASFNTAPFLFVGSGLSRRYLNLETWGKLLRKFTEIIEKDYRYYFSRSDGDFPKLATFLANDFHEIWWNDLKFKENRNSYRSAILNIESPLKIEISDYMRNLKSQLTKDKNLLQEINLLQQAVVDGIITTNWDLFLENNFKDFKTYIGQNELIFSTQQGVAEIYKIHGCCTEPNSLILTESDYIEFEERNNYLAAKLLTIFTEHPIIFFGYSLTDKNINQIIQSITSCLTTNNIEKLRDRLIFIKYSTDNTDFFKNQLIVDGLQIPVITIEMNSFIPIFEVLSEIKRKFPAKVLRQLKEHIYELVKNNDENNEQLYVQDIDDEEIDFSNLEVVFGVGVISNEKGAGYSAYERKDLFENIVFDNRDFDSRQIIEKTLPKILSGATYVPLFKYLRAANLINNEGELIQDDFEIPSRVKEHFEKIKVQGKAFFDPKGSYLNKKYSFKEEKRNLLEYEQEEGTKKLLTYFNFFSELNTNSLVLEDLMRRNYEFLQSNNSTDMGQFIKMICLYDYLKFYKEI